MAFISPHQKISFKVQELFFDTGLKPYFKALNINALPYFRITGGMHTWQITSLWSEKNKKRGKFNVFAPKLC